MSPARNWGGQKLLDPGYKCMAVDRPVKHQRRQQPILAQRADKRRGVPVAERRISQTTLTLGRAAPSWRHVGGGPGVNPERSAARWSAKLARPTRPCAPGRRRFAFVRWHAPSFFSRQPQPGQCLAHGRDSDLHAVLGPHPLAQLRQRLLRRRGHLPQQWLLQSRQAQRHMGLCCAPALA